MSNVLKVSLQATIYSLHDRGWSRRRIARELGIDRETVGRYLLLAKPAISTTGVEGTGKAKPAISTAGKGTGRKSQCEPLTEAIVAKVEVGYPVPSSGISAIMRSVEYSLGIFGQSPSGYLDLRGDALRQTKWSTRLKSSRGRDSSRVTCHLGL
jgi:hypothetical protein